MNTYQHTDNDIDSPSKPLEVVGGLLSNYKIQETKHKYEFQEVCEELEPIYGKAIWTLPHKVGFTEYKIRKAHEIANGRNILEFKYLVGIIKRL